ncbi:F-box-like domain superfamily [Arabidopsis thaliana x Arabidopsis arenosa]|uniref:F-box-like domain superfamily n=1 Tax=Arabidopsis thaliana x Arabidopsis arenosa TaxID=1240361 RepID=A0A8T1YAW3_9BRAS|nr:F-box-like domain superfamily [Arabidopsis thaliana x Arabidopsis arenosa]
MKLRSKPPEKKKKKRTTDDSSPTPSSSSPSFSSLPDEIAVNCLARISRSYYPSLSVVSKSFRSILSSAELYAARSHLGNTEQCVYVCLWDKSYQFPKWFTLWTNPNRANSMIEKKRKKKKIIMVPATSSNFPYVSQSSVVVGSEIYLIDRAPSSAVPVRVLTCGSHTWRDAPSMTVVRKYPNTYVYNGKIYVMGGCEGLEDEPWAEVFDTKTQTWEPLPDPGTEVRKNYICSIGEIGGKIQIHFGKLKEMYAYDTKQCKWESRVNKYARYARPECMIENVSFFFASEGGLYGQGQFRWYDKKKGYWKEVKGLDSLLEKHRKNGGSSGNTTKLVSCGGKLLLIWEGYMKHNPNDRKKIWCAEIGIENHDGDELCGNVEWFDVLHTVPTSCQLLHCLAVSV